MTGLSLAGGGVRGSYQVGAFYALKKCGIKFDGYVGTSIGSFNAAMLAAGKEKELLKFWQNINVGKIIGFSEKYIKEIENNHKTTGVFTHLAHNVKDVISNKGFSTDGLMQILEEVNLEEAVKKSKKDFGLCTVRAKDFTPIYRFKEDIPPGKFNEYVIASCYLPVFKMQKIIDETYYIDGGFYDNSPVNMLLDKGYNKVYAIDLSAVGIKRKVKDKNKVITIKPSRNLKSILNTNLNDIKYNIKLGYYDTIKVIKDLDGSKYIFKKINPWIYSWLIRKVNPKLRKEMELWFHTFNDKKLVIRALEYVMEKNKYEYTEIYNPIRLIKEIKRGKRNYGVYRFIKDLRLF